MQSGSYLYKFLRVFLGAFLLTKVYLAYRLGKCYGAKLLWRQHNIQVSMKINIICNLYCSRRIFSGSNISRMMQRPIRSNSITWFCSKQ